MEVVIPNEEEQEDLWDIKDIDVVKEVQQNYIDYLQVEEDEVQGIIKIDSNKDYLKVEQIV